MLSAIKHYVLEKQTANLLELALHFKRDPEIVRCMMQHWIRKGTICVADKPQGCGVKCIQCKPAFTEVYQVQGS